MRRLVIAALLVAVAVPASAGAATPKPPGYKEAWFRVIVDGVQRNSWQTHQVGGGRCGSTVTGQGTEKVRFTSSPVLMKVITIRGLSNPVFTRPTNRRNQSPVVPIRGAVTRAGTLSATPVPRDCQGTGGGSPSRDCGTRPVRGQVAFGYTFAVRAGDYVEVIPNGGAIADPFANCPGGLTRWPNLLTRADGKRPIVERLAEQELFDRSLRKLIVIGSGRATEGPPGAQSTTSIRWVVTLYRVR